MSLATSRRAVCDDSENLDIINDEEIEALINDIDELNL